MNDSLEGSSPYTTYVDPSVKPTISSASPEKSPPNISSAKELDEIIKLSDRKKIKKILRTNTWPLNHEVRRGIWWKLCCASHGRNHLRTPYKEIAQEVFGEGDGDCFVQLPTFVDPCHLEHHYLSEVGVSAAKKLLSVIAHERPDIVYCPLLFGMTCLLLHYMEEQECYDCINYLISSKEKHLAQTKTAYEASALVLKELTKKYAKPSFQSMVKRTPDIELVLQDWSWWIMKDLPFAYIVRVIDCYLFEGPKVLYRIALAILIHFNRHTVKSSPRKGEGNVVKEIEEFCRNIPLSSSKLLKTAFGIRGLSRSEMRKLILRKEIYIQSKHNVAMLQGTMPTSPSAGSLSLLVARDTGSHIVSKKEHLDVGSRPRSCSQGETYFPAFLNTRSAIVGSEEWKEIYSWLPKRFTLKQPKLIFSTCEHGTSLSTFYNRIEGYEPTFLAIKTSRQEVFGAYCSVDWIERNAGARTLQYFGTGESFICTIHPKKIKYCWVGVTLKDKTPNSAHLFLSGDSAQISIGGGNGTAILLDENLLKGVSQRCDTFDNPPLAEGGMFTVTVLEVFGFE